MTLSAQIVRIAIVLLDARVYLRHEQVGPGRHGSGTVSMAYTSETISAGTGSLFRDSSHCEAEDRGIGGEDTSAGYARTAPAQDAYEGSWRANDATMRVRTLVGGGSSEERH